MSMPDEFRSFIQSHHLVESDGRILLAVSGGIDSMAMAHLFLSIGMRPGIAHCNFSLRAAESDMDEEFVRDFAKQHDLPFYSVRFNTREYARNRKISVQMAARELRYEWFEKIRKTYHYDLIAVAHNLNDNIETLLINLTRGTGLTGLSGIRPSVNHIVRPLLFATRQKITEYCNENRIAFREDRSNAGTKYTRNKIRHLVLPILKEINPSVEETLNETAQRFASLDKIIAGHVDQLIRTTSVSSGYTTIFSVNKLTELNPDRALLFEVFSRYGITGSGSSGLFGLLKGRTGKMLITETHRIVKNRNELIVAPVARRESFDYLISKPVDLNDVPGIMSAEITDRGPDFIIPCESNVACIDLDRISFPLVIRGWKRGDFFYPLGMNGKKKLSDYLTDRKYSLPGKENARILESDGKIVWILGERLDERFKVTSSTTKILLIRLRPCRSS
jgi:tRNA(Ile)-lysidine synthase